MKKEELLSLDKETLVEIILTLTVRLSELEAKVNMDSRNSSKPPSSDWKPAKIPREKTGAKQGGQLGHQGNYLRIEQESDERVELKANTCKKCGESLYSSGTLFETRRKVDVEIRTKVTEYEQYETVCTCCGTENKEEFPADVKSHISYGEGVQSIGVLLTNYANVSYGKTQKIMNDVLEVPISTGTLVNHVKEFSVKSEPVNLY